MPRFGFASSADHTGIKRRKAAQSRYLKCTTKQHRSRLFEGFPPSLAAKVLYLQPFRSEPFWWFRERNVPLSLSLSVGIWSCLRGIGSISSLPRREPCLWGSVGGSQNPSKSESRSQKKHGSRVIGPLSLSHIHVDKSA